MQVSEVPQPVVLQSVAGGVVGAEASEEEEEVEVVEDDMSLGLGMHKYPCFTKTQ